MANGLSFIGPPEAPVRGTTQTALDPGVALIEQLLAHHMGQLEMTPAPQPPPQIGPANRFFGTLGDAISRAGLIRGGISPPPIGKFAATTLAREQEFQTRLAESETVNRNLRNRVRFGVFNKELDILANMLSRSGEQEPEYFRAEGQTIVDEAGNMFFEGFAQKKGDLEFERVLIPLPSSRSSSPIGQVRRSSQPLILVDTPDGKRFVNTTAGGFAREPTQAGAGEAPTPPGVEPTQPPVSPPTPDTREKDPIPPISNEANVNAIQAEQILLDKAQTLLPFIERLAEKEEGQGPLAGPLLRAGKRFVLTTPGISGLGGRAGITTLDPDFSSLVSGLKDLQSAFEEERTKGGRLTNIRLGELSAFLPRGDEAFGVMRGQIQSLIDDVTKKINLRRKLQPGQMDKLGGAQDFAVPDAEFQLYQQKRGRQERLSNAETARYRQGLQERIAAQKKAP